MHKKQNEEWKPSVCRVSTADAIPEEPGASTEPPQSPREPTESHPTEPHRAHRTPQIPHRATQNPAECRRDKQNHAEAQPHIPHPNNPTPPRATPQKPTPRAHPHRAPLRKTCILFFFLKICSFFFFNYVYVEERVCAHKCRCPQRCQIPLELRLGAVVSHLIWVLGLELRSSGRALCALNH